MKKEEMMLKATQMLAKGKFKLKKAGPTIMIVGAAIGGVTAAVLACKATLKAEEIIAEHNAQIETIHTTKAQVDSGEMQLKDGETYTADDMKKDITATYVHTAVWLAKVYAPAVTLGGISLACMFGSHHIMSKRNASLTAAYIAIDKAFNEYKGRVTERFGDRVQRELEHNIKAVEVESTAKNEDGTEEVIREYTDVARDANDPYSMIFDESCSLWEKDSMLNAMTMDTCREITRRKAESGRPPVLSFRFRMYLRRSSLTKILCSMISARPNRCRRALSTSTKTRTWPKESTIIFLSGALASSALSNPDAAAHCL